jgi:hypothetical protein
MRKLPCALIALLALLPGQPLSLADFAPWGAPLGHEDGGRLLTKSAYACMHDSRLKVSTWVVYRA